MRLLVDAALSILFAPECAACGEPLERPTEGPVCAGCWLDVRPLAPPFCHRCGEPLLRPAVETSGCSRCSDRHWPLDGVRALGAYEGCLRTLVHALKYSGRRSIAPRLAARLRAQHAAFLAQAAAAVPVPLHSSRRRERGFNQAADLARHLGLPVVHALKRTRRTLIQAELAAAERHDNVSGAFKPTCRVGSLAGETVMLVDDVSTTGATLSACAVALKAAGVRYVYAITAARAVLSPR